jgi:hypothetical protein
MMFRDPWWPANPYVSGDDKLRQCLVVATLEHLFENREIAKFFSDWKNQEILADAYERAIKWSRRGGRTPLGTVTREPRQR